MATLDDIAQALGVSKSTVSKALSGAKDVSNATRQSILEKAGEMTDMLAIQQGKTGEELADYIRRFCKRKWNSEFSVEMSRSCTEMVKDWLK